MRQKKDKPGAKRLNRQRISTERGGGTLYYVAAHDSPPGVTADFICDGTDDQKEIQEAVDRLRPSGGTVCLLSGRFNISMPIMLKSKTTLRGAEGNPGSELFLQNAPRSKLRRGAAPGDRHLVLTAPNGFMPEMTLAVVSDKFRFAAKIQSVENDVIELHDEIKAVLSAENAELWGMVDMINISGARDVTVSGITVDGNAENQLVFMRRHAYLEISGKRVAATDGSSAILINEGSENISIENCRVHNTQSEGIFALGAGSGLRLINNTLENIGDKGIVTCRVAGDGVISGNHISSTGKQEELTPYDSKWGWGDCINLHPSSGARWIISNNVLSKARRSGIRITGASESIVSNNLISDCGDYGIIAGVRHQNIFRGNSISNCGGGIALAFPDGAVKTGGSVISENIITASKQHGIMCCGANSCVVLGNIIKRNLKHGIIVTDRAYEDVDPANERWPDHPVRGSGCPEDIIVTQNILSDNGRGSTPGMGDIEVRGSSNVRILENLQTNSRQ
jgi:parallel beta-helix repeat protein